MTRKISHAGVPPRALVLIGTRPEAIKMAPVIRALRTSAPHIETRVLLTGQHTELVDEVLRVFAIEPDWSLGIMREGQSLFEVSERALHAVGPVLREWRPGMLLVQGDTASVFLGALAAYFEGIATGHVEAGLRSGDLRAPFPEEGFRKLTGVLAQLHFAPTEGARANLLREGVAPERILVTGNTVVDALLQIEDSRPEPHDSTLRGLLVRGDSFVLMTAHRRESFGAPLEAMFRGILELADRHSSLQILYPVHPNPQVREPAQRILGSHPRVHLVAPLLYPDLVLALRHAAVVVTDSGGIQEEAPTFGTPVIVLREVTERPEGIEAGVARLVGMDPDRMLDEVGALLAAPSTDRHERRQANPYGDGRAGARIAERVAEFLGGDG